MVSITITSYAADNERYCFILSDIVENYKPYSENELASFKAELSEKEMLEELLYPNELARVFVISNRNRIQKGKSGRRSPYHDLFGDDDVIMGIKAENGFVNLPYAESRMIEDGSYFAEGNVFGSAEGQFCYLHFSDEALKYLSLMSYQERECFLLSFFLSVMNTEEAIGLNAAKLLKSESVAEEGHAFGLIDERVFESPTFNLCDIIENNKQHSENEIAAFKAELSEKEMLWNIIYPEVCANVYAVSNHETLRTVKRGTDNVFGDENVIMGIKKDNPFVTIAFSGKNKVITGSALYGSGDGQFCRMLFSDSALDFLNSLSYSERENFMLDFWLSVMDTDEAIGLTYDKIYRGKNGDVNGDGNVNALDSYALAGFVIGNGSEIVPQNCDIDGNGTINTKDNFYVKKLLLGI